MKLAELKKKLDVQKGNNQALKNYILHHFYARLEIMNFRGFCLCNSDLESTFLIAMQEFGLAQLAEEHGPIEMPNLKKYERTPSGLELYRDFVKAGYSPSKLSQ